MGLGYKGSTRQTKQGRPPASRACKCCQQEPCSRWGTVLQFQAFRSLLPETLGCDVLTWPPQRGGQVISNWSFPVTGEANESPFLNRRWRSGFAPEQQRPARRGPTRDPHSRRGESGWGQPSAAELAAAAEVTAVRVGGCLRPWPKIRASLRRAAPTPVLRLVQ